MDPLRMNSQTWEHHSCLTFNGPTADELTNMGKPLMFNI